MHINRLNRVFTRWEDARKALAIARRMRKQKILVKDLEKLYSTIYEEELEPCIPLVNWCQLPIVIDSKTGKLSISPRNKEFG